MCFGEVPQLYIILITFWQEGGNSSPEGFLLLPAFSLAASAPAFHSPDLELGAEAQKTPKPKIRTGQRNNMATEESVVLQEVLVEDIKSRPLFVLTGRGVNEGDELTGEGKTSFQPNTQRKRGNLWAFLQCRTHRALKC